MDDERREHSTKTRAPARLGAAPTRAHAHHAPRCGSGRTAGVLHRRVHRRLAADPHVRPAGSADWAPLTDTAVKGRNLFAQNGCYVCHSGYSRPQDVREALYFLYPKVSQPGDFYGSDQSPNLLGTERTGPDLSQESGWHPDDWQRAHFYDPRFVDPLSLMPPMKSLFSDTQIEQLITYVETRSGKSGLLRYAGQLYSKHVVTTNQGFAQAPTGFQGAHAKILEGNDDILNPPKDQLEEAPNLAQIDRSYWLSGESAAGDRAEPDARQRGLLAAVRRLPRHRRRRQRSRRVVHVTGTRGLHERRRRMLRRRHRPGDFYYRILRGWPGTGMENFGDRLSVDDIWRVVHVREDDPEPHAEKERGPRTEGLHRLAALEGAAGLAQEPAEARRGTRPSRRRRSRTRSCRKR